MPKIIIPYKPRPIFVPIHKEIEKHRFISLVAHRRTGKTVFLINLLGRQAVLCEKKNPQYAYIAPQLKQAKIIAWRYLKDYFRVFPDFRANETELYIEFGASSNGTRRIYLCGADNPDALRGAYWDGVVLDEFAQMNPDMWDEIILPSITDRKGFAVLCGTPKGMNHFYEKYVEFTNKYQENPNGLYYSVFLDVYHTGVFSDDEIAVIRESMTETKFRQEYLCDWSASNEDILIPLDIVSQAMKKELDWTDYSTSPRVLGVDVARFGDDSSVLFPRQGLYAYEPIRYAKMDNMELASHIAEFMSDFQPACTFIDAGRGEGVIDRLRQLGFQNVVEVNFGKRSPRKGYANMRAFMWDNVRKWLLRGGRLPKNDALLVDLATPTYKMDLSDNMVLESKADIKKRIGHSTDFGDALALTFSMPVTTPEIENQREAVFKNVRAYKTFNPNVHGFDGRR